MKIPQVIPEEPYFKGDVDLSFVNASDIFCDAQQDDTSLAIFSSCPRRWRECHDVCVDDHYGEGLRVVLPMTVYCRIEETRAAHISDAEVCTMLQQALDKMVKGLVRESDWDPHVRILVKHASKVTLTGVARLTKPDGVHARILNEKLGYDLDEDEDELDLKQAS